ncbi:MAG: phospholipid carrier-dependent glycosyltransferase [Brevinematales bacterium]|nr:phospholipid carrier-dependent glycosyltransferase [Brevinematales bacterium]
MQKKLILLFLFLISGIVYFTNYWYPDGLFWDENYHISSAQKYIDGVMFMEPHPPLGKQLIALGEKIFNLFGVNKNIDKSYFNTTDYITNVPEKFSFAGFRFASTLFGMLSVIVIFFIFLKIFDNQLYALFFSFLYLFDNAITMHSRSAMLEGIQLFFVLLSIFYFLKILEKNKRNLKEYFLLGIFSGLAISVKLNSAIVLLLFVFLVWEDYENEILKLSFSFKMLKDLSLKTLISIVGIILPIFISFYIHFAIAKNVIQGRNYNASEKYREILIQEETANPFNFFIMLKDYIEYMDRYEKGVPKWDPTKPGENGSPAFMWPFGYKTINYRWTKWRGVVAYMYLQGNPLVWFLGLFGVILSTVFILGRLFFNVTVRDKKRFKYITYFSILYFSYMFAMLKIERVMYLYHYFIPLILSFILFALIFLEFFKEYIEKKDKLTLAIVSLMAIEIIAVFLFYSPFTYYIPLDSIQFMQRVWSKVWGLTPITY